MKLTQASIVLALFHGSNAACPFFKSDGRRRLQGTYHADPHHRVLQSPRTGDGGVPEGGYDAVKTDITALLTDSQDFWPADFADTPIGANYGPFMIRLAWHCAGSYRNTDGRGGCDGARIRFDPENSWPDNGNLDKALKLLEPIKEKYGSDLSWGDLIILAGTTAIESMGGPILGFCGGRIDDADGSDSLILGPSEEQEILTPCVTIGQDGNCSGNLGPIQVGKIYVNPAGHLEDSDPSGQIIDDIRSVFEKMGMNDTETIALTGGGHAFGKTHGACPDPPCGEGDMAGIGINTFTEGFEGPWTTAPTTWTNQYFTNLFDYDWKLITGPGGKEQWAPAPLNGVDPVPDIMMLTADIAHVRDPEYLRISKEFADDITKLDMAFKHAWYKLTNADMGPRERCLGDDIPPPQPFQSPLPKSPDTLADFIPIRQKIQDVLANDKSKREAFTSLASKCASTFRDTDYQGGCNGAYVRFDDDDETKDTMTTLTAIKDAHPDASYADIIVLAAQVALEDAQANEMVFCGGRTDATESDAKSQLDNNPPIVYDASLNETVKIKDAMTVQGLTFRQGVALAGMPSGSYDMSNQFFEDLLAAADAGEQGTYTAREWALVQDEELKEIVEVYAENSDEFMEEFTSGWSYLMTADRFDGPRVNACSDVATPTLVDGGDTTEPGDKATDVDTPDVEDASGTEDSAATMGFASVAIGSILGVVGVLVIM